MPKKDLGMVIEDMVSEISETIENVVDALSGSVVKTTAEFYEIFEDMEWDKNDKGDMIFKGLCIIAKYIDPSKTNIVTFATHDEIWSVTIDQLIEAGITKDDAINLRKLHWSLNRECDCLFSFV